MNPSPKSRPAPALITFGRGGHSVYHLPEPCGNAVSNLTSSGYRSPENFFENRRGDAADPKEREAEIASFQGCPVIDMREAVKTAAGMRMTISGPMVDPGLADEEVSKCPAPSAMLEEGLRNSQVGGLMALASAQRAVGVRAGAFDFVSVPEYVRLWRAAGARIGVVRGQAIEFQEQIKAPEVASPREAQEEMSLGELGGLQPPAVASGPARAKVGAPEM